MSSPFLTVSLEDLVAAVRRQQADLPALAWMPPEPSGTVTVTVHGAHAGAGASTVAVALADVLEGRGEGDVTLVDLAKADEFGSSEAMQIRADLGLSGWVGGRRGGARMVRLADQHPDDIVGNVVIDARDRGWGLDIDVLVCRASVPSVRRAESILSGRRARAVAVVGAGKWPRPVRSSLGPHLRAAWVSGGVVFFPHDSALEVNGLSAEPLPTTTLRSAATVLGLLAHAELGAHAHRDGDLP
jgi:hypothetical protein